MHINIYIEIRKKPCIHTTNIDLQYYAITGAKGKVLDQIPFGFITYQDA